MESSYVLAYRLRGNDTLGLAPSGETSCFIRLKCYPIPRPIPREALGGDWGKGNFRKESQEIAGGTLRGYPSLRALEEPI